MEGGDDTIGNGLQHRDGFSKHYACQYGKLVFEM